LQEILRESALLQEKIREEKVIENLPGLLFIGFLEKIERKRKIGQTKKSNYSEK